MKKIICLLTCVVLLLSVLGACGPKEAAAVPIKVAFMMDFTSVQASFTPTCRDGFFLAIDEFNDAGGINGHKIDVTVMDDELKADRCTTLAERAITVDKVMAIVGGSTSTEAFAIQKVIDEHKVPFLCTVASAIPLTDPIDPWLFRSPEGSTLMWIEVLIDTAVSFGKRIALAHTTSAYGVDASDWTEKILMDKFGLKVVAREAVAPGTIDLTPHVLALKAANPDVIIDWNLTKERAMALKARAELGWLVPTISAFSSTVDAIAITGEVHAEHIAIAGLDPTNPVAIEMLDKYEKRYGKRPSTNNEYMPLTYDEGLILIEGLKRAKLSYDLAKLAEDRAKLRDAIETITGLPAACGKAGSTIDYSPSDHDGMIPKNLVIKRTLDGINWELWSPK